MKPIVIRYNEGYWVKFSFRYHRETECEGGGWYSYTGNKYLVCNSSRIKHLSQIPKEEGEIGFLSQEANDLFHIALCKYEQSPQHKQLLKAECKIKP